MPSTGFNAKRAFAEPDAPVRRRPLLSHISGLYLITAVCGLVDAACYLSLGGVFAEIITGNMLFLTFGLGSGLPFAKLYRYMLVIAAFAVGAAAGGRAMRGDLQDRRLGFVVEWMLLVGALAATLLLHPGQSGAARDLVISCLASAMGLQNALIRRHGVPDLATDVMTLTVTALIAESRLGYGGEPDRRRRRFASVALFLVSATLGALLTRHFGPAAPLALSVAIFSVALLGIDPRHSTGSQPAQPRGPPAT